MQIYSRKIPFVQHEVLFQGKGKNKLFLCFIGKMVTKLA